MFKIQIYNIKEVKKYKAYFGKDNHELDSFIGNYNHEFYSYIEVKSGFWDKI